MQDYVQYSSKRGNDRYGIKGYFLRSTCELDKPLIAKIHSGKRETYIDDEIRMKKGVPSANYEVTGDMVSNKKSKIDKAPRKTMADEIASFEKRNKRPAPGAFKPEYT